MTDDHSAPEGASCGEHPDRPAHFTCPRCGSYACIFCWRPTVERCAACLARDPAEAAPPIPWERPDTGALVAYLATFATALRPVRTAPAFARDDVAPARRFFWLSALPLAMLAGVIPHTRTLAFGDVFGVKLLGHPDALAVALDVARAVVAQVAILGVEVAFIALPFASLIRAYGHPKRRTAAVRLVLYRVWLVPGAALLFYLVVWAMPAVGQADLVPLPYALLVAASVVLPLYLMLLAMGATARLACGLGLFMSLVVVLVPLVLTYLTRGVAVAAVEALLPPLDLPVTM